MDDRIKFRPVADLKPAKALGRPDLGVLKPGAAADASVLAIEDGEFPLDGVRGEVVEAARRIFARGAVVGGEWWLSA
jgi:dihydroorotase